MSTLAPEWSGAGQGPAPGLGRDMLDRVRPAGLITHRFPAARRSEAYRLLDEAPGEAIQVVLTYT